MLEKSNILMLMVSNASFVGKKTVGILGEQVMDTIMLYVKERESKMSKDTLPRPPLKPCPPRSYVRGEPSKTALTYKTIVKIPIDKYSSTPFVAFIDKITTATNDIADKTKLSFEVDIEHDYEDGIGDIAIVVYETQEIPNKQYDEQMRTREKEKKQHEEKMERHRVEMEKYEVAMEKYEEDMLQYLTNKRNAKQ